MIKKQENKEGFGPSERLKSPHTHLEGSFCFIYLVSLPVLSLLRCSQSPPLTGIRDSVHLLVFFRLIQMCFTQTGSAPHLIHSTPLSPKVQNVHVSTAGELLALVKTPCFFEGHRNVASV